MDTILKNIFYLILFVNAYILLKTFTLTRQLIKTYSDTRNNLARWQSGLINLEDVNNLTPKEFKYWCGEFISGMGYTNIAQITDEEEDGKDIICRKDNKTTYVKCKRHFKEALDKYTVNTQECKLLVGAMVHAGIHEGMIITSGTIEEECFEYVRTLPEAYTIKLMDGKKIVDLYHGLHRNQKRKAA